MRTKNETIREEILTCAINQFAEKGYAAVNLAEIASELNISRAPLYYYFSNKSELYTAAVLRCIEQQKHDYTNILTADKAFIDMIKEDFLYCLRDKGLFSRIGRGGKDEPDLSNIRNEFSQWLIDLKYEVFLKCQERHEIPASTDLSELITFIYIYYYGVINLQPISSTINGLNQNMIQNSVDSFIEIIKKKFLDK